MINPSTIRSISLALLIPAAGTAQFSQVQKLTDTDPDAGQQLGRYVAASGSTYVIGDPIYGSTDRGRVTVVTRVGDSWSTQYLTASNAADDDEFGLSVAIDGDTIVVGQVHDDWTTTVGSVYVFTRVGSTWTEQVRLTPNSGVLGTSFGSKVAVDGDTIAVSAPNDSSAGQGAGKIYIYTGSGANWTEQEFLPSDLTEFDSFGSSIAVSGETVVVGAQNGTGLADFTGSAYVYTRSGSVWSEQKIYSSDAVQFAGFGSRVAIDANTMVIGAHRDSVAGNNSGAAYTFVHNGSSWIEQQKLSASDASAEQNFGSAVAIDRDTIVIGAGNHLGVTDGIVPQGPGAAYRFERVGSSWVQQQGIIADDGQDADGFGENGLAMTRATLVVGARGHGSNGASYVFDLPNALGSLTAFGPGCTNSTGHVTALGSATGSMPALDTQFGYEVTDAPANAVGAFLLGFAPLVADLAPIGAPGCILHGTADVSEPFATDANGTATSAIVNLPDAPSLVGYSFYVEAAIVDDGPNALGLVMSDAYQATVGWQ